LRETHSRLKAAGGKVRLDSLVLIMLRSKGGNSEKQVGVTGGLLRLGNSNKLTEEMD
jgi:hypothetical protein